VLTGRDQRENARTAIGLGAYDFLCKPVQVDDLRIILGRALYVHGLEIEQAAHRRLSEGDSFEGMLGVSPPMQEVFATIRKVAPTEVPVLILGESGTGKELAALAVHNLSRRGKAPFEAINCGAIPENLLESELFGHEKGAFTGAHSRVRGRIESAQGGTLFLDEIGELSLPLQVKLLRYLQEQVIERVGGREKIQVDARVVAATNTDVREAMRNGRFREDLFHRLSVVTVRMPPLRERTGDVELLARVFLERYVRENRKQIKGFTRQALQMLEVQAWPGNVRELENRIKRAAIMAEGRHVTPADLELTKTTRFAGMGLKQAREELERELITQALSRTGMNISKAAGELGISRPALYELMEKLGIKR
jgi:two-component system NtrC family response regulator